MKRQLWIVLLTALASVMGLAQAAAQSSQTESLGDLARKVREEKAKSGTKPVKVYTNDDIPKNVVIGVDIVSVGSLSASIGHPREIFKAAILKNAAAIILAHNSCAASHEFSCGTQIHVWPFQ